MKQNAFKNRILIISLILIFIVAVPFNSKAQFFLKGGFGYGFGVQKLLIDAEYTSDSTRNVYGSFGGSWGFYLGGGVELNRFIDLELDLGYQNGRSVTVDNYFFDKTFTGRFISIVPSLSFKTSISENYSPYAKIGLLTGFPIMSVDVSGDVKKFRGGFPLGVTEAIGLNLNATDWLKFFVEITHQSLIYKPTSRKEPDGTIVKFKDEIKYPEPENEEITHHFFSFGDLGANIGVKIVL